MQTKKGKPCKHCGGTTRYASNRKCVECARANQARWRQEHPEEHSEYQLSYNWRKRKDIKRATPAWADPNAISHIYQECERLSQKMGIELLVAHEVPLRGRNVCGLHVEYNLKVVSKSWAKSRRIQILKESGFTAE